MERLAEGETKPMTESGDPRTFLELYTVLHEDVYAIAGPSQPGERDGIYYPDPARLSQRDRRNLVRTVFAFIEATTFQLRVLLAKNWRDAMSDAQLLALRDLQVDVLPSGAVKTKALKCGLVPLIRLTVSAYSHVLPEAATVTCDGPGFDAVARSVRVRDRLMHPKTIDAVVVTDSEIREALTAFAWVHDTSEKLLEAAYTQLTIRVDELKERVEASKRANNLLQTAAKTSGLRKDK